MTLQNDKGQTPDDVCKGFPLGICTHDDLQSWTRLLDDIRSKVRRAVAANPGHKAAAGATLWADSAQVADFIALGGPTIGEHSREVIERIVMECRNGNDWLGRLDSPDAVPDPRSPIGLGTVVIWAGLAWVGFKVWESVKD